MRNRVFSLAFACLFLAAPVARGDDWPQWLGPRRDGVWREDGLAAQFPKTGPAVRWRAPVAAGYSGPAVAGGRVFVTDRVPGPGTSRPADPFQRITLPGVERVLCFNAADGEMLWMFPYDCPYTVSYSAGPRATPAVDGDRVYTVGAEGHLHCLDTGTGEVRWSARLGGDDATPLWGYAAHPLIDGNKLICVTTRPDALVTALDKMTGKVLWTSLSAKEPGYSAPLIVDAGGKRQLVFWHPQAVVGLDPETGKVYWTVPLGPVQNNVSIATPQFVHDEKLGDLLFVTSQYDGSIVLKLAAGEGGKPTASILWKRAGKNATRTDALHVLMAPPVVRGGHVYGVDTTGPLRCLSLANGDRLWETTAPTTKDDDQKTWVTAFLTPLGDKGDRFAIANELGDLILADLSPRGYKEVGRAHLLDPTNTDAQRPVLWSMPAYANRAVYWRNDKELICASLAADAAK